MDSSVNKYLKQTESCSSDINILLLGETGVGKSTFINSFANYLSYDSLSKVRKNELLCLIPTRFAMVDVDFEEKIIEFGKDKNEDTELGNSSTQGARAYIFNHKDGFKIRLIDTPGIGDSRGLEQDKKNFENILTYIGQFENLHAICFLLKPNESVLNAYFKFCLMHLLSRLEKSASANICFIFTNSRSTFYKPGETLSILKRVLNDIEKNPPYVKIPCSKDNMFCVDNEGFKYLVSSKQQIKFGSKEVDLYSNSFNKSVEACHRLVNYIRGDSLKEGLIPHVIQKTLSVNEARRVIIDLSRPLADIADLIEDNIIVLERHQKSILTENITITELQKKLYIPAINIKQTTLTQPVTVCTSSKCSETYTVEGITKYHYKQRCHNPCYLTNVPTELIGSPELKSCAAMGGTQNCRQCGCHFTSHMHILYETNIEQIKLEDDTVKVKIRSKEDMVKQQFRMIQNLQARSSAYEGEKKTISQNMAKFAHFLEKSSIVLYNDSYIDYIDYLIDRENSLGNERDRSLILRYQELKKNYEQEKHILNMALKSKKVHDRNAVLLQPKDIFSGVQSLYSLKFTGKKIKELHLQQERLRKAEHGHFMEYHCPSLQTTDSEYESDAGVSQVKILRDLLKEKSLAAARLKINALDLTSQFSDDIKIDEFKQELFDLVSEMFGKNKQADADKKGALPKQNKGRRNFKPKRRSNNNFQPHPNQFPRNPPPMRGNYHNGPNFQPPIYQQNSYHGQPPRYNQNFQNNPPAYHQHNPPNYQHNPPNYQHNSPNYQHNPPNYQHIPPNFPRNPNYFPPNYQQQNQNNPPPDFNSAQQQNSYRNANSHFHSGNNSGTERSNLSKKLNNLTLNELRKEQGKFSSRGNTYNNRYAETNDSSNDSSSVSDSDNKESREMELVRKFIERKKKNAQFILMYKK